MDYLPLCDGPGERHIALAMLADDDPRLIDRALLKTEIVIHHPACRIAVNPAAVKRSIVLTGSSARTSTTGFVVGV